MNGINDKISLTGMVLAAAPLREADKRLVLLTKEKGKVTVFARGARRPGNPFLAAANPFAFGTFQVQESGSAYRLIQVEIRNYFREISEDMESACYGSYFLEFADYYARENDDGAMLLQLLYAALRALLNPKLDNCLIRYTFELRTMAEGGEYPQVFQCTVCGSDQNLCAIWPKKNSVLCKHCRTRISGSIPVLESTIYTMQYMITTSPQRLFAFTVSAQVRKELVKEIDDFRCRYIDRHFRSLEILDMMQQTRNALYKDGY